MRVRPNYSRYDPGGGFRPAPESGVVCLLCGYEIGARENFDFYQDGVCHADCLKFKIRSDDDEL